MIRYLGLLVVLATVLGGGVAVSAQDLVLGYSASNTGPYATQAKRNGVAIEVALDEINAAGGINGKKLTVQSFDTGGKPEQAVVAVQRFAQDVNALAVIGPFSSSECRVAFPVGDRLGIMQMAMGSTAPKLAASFTFSFRNTVEENYTWERLLKTIQRKNIPHASIAIAYATDDAVSQAVGSAVLPERIKVANLNLTDTVTFRVSAFDFSAQVSQLMQKPSDLMAVGTPPDTLLRFVAELRRQGYKGRILGGSSIADVDLPERMGPPGEGTMVGATFYAGMEDARTKTFVERFKAKLKVKGEAVIDPSQFDAATYDIVYMYADAMKRAKVTGDVAKLAAERRAIRDQIKSLKDYPALVGPLSMGPDNDVIKTIYILEAKANHWTLVDKHPD
ncbi:MAG: branched-chain amino acid transport system substrate-binding protein [Bradyrhizobium sp.]|jgi:branched-chain amino acid transport system substrate-binding protein|nr:branched-chain amino acid transport system substrate-binding protein [Bradyrhizobium sp.]